MVESNQEEERLARIERMLEQLQRDSAAFKGIAAKVMKVAADVAPAVDALSSAQGSRKKL